MQGDLEAAYAARLEAAQTAVRTGSESLLRWFGGSLSDHRYRRGDWDEAFLTADALITSVEAGTPNVGSWQAYGIRAEIRLARGDLDGARADAEKGLETARSVGEVQALCFALTAAGHVLTTAGDVERARSLVDEQLSLLRSGTDMQFAVINLPLLAAAADRLGLVRELAQTLARPAPSLWAEVVLAYAAGEFTVAADILQEVGSKPDEAEARARAAEQLATDGRNAEAEEQRSRALEFYRSVGAAHFVRRCEAVLAPLED